MSIDTIETIAIEHRLQQKLPIQTKYEEKYFRDRFYWIVDKFKEQYFVDGEKLDTNTILDEMFSSINDNVGDLNLSKLDDFKIALACSFIAITDKFDCSLKVTTDFFQDQFLRVIDQRFHRQSDIAMDLAGFLSKVLINVGVEKDKALMIIETGVLLAETQPQYDFSQAEFLVKIIDGIVEECEQLKIS